MALCHLCIAPKSNHSPIRPPEEAIHKCRLLDTEIPAITYNSGGTYTLGALQQALDVLQVRQSIRFCFSSSEFNLFETGNVRRIRRTCVQHLVHLGSNVSNRLDSRD